ncbi:MAG: dihydropteroate synthase [Victivallales bacterium]|nr:dihydropteroate synthase [Victivallales bacterium]
MKFRYQNGCFDCGCRTRIMGILNVTPDSFSDGNEYFSESAAVARALEMHHAGADVIDIGGESSRPGASPVTVEEEMKRVIPVVRALKTENPEIVISVDTTKSEVAKAALDEGAEIINDISGLLADPHIAAVAAASGAGLILMHMRGTPATMNSLRNYDDLLQDVMRELENAAKKALSAGVPRECLMLDPGIGFAKNKEQNILLIKHISRFSDLGYPLLVGPSRKSFIGEITGQRDPAKRAWGTAGAVAWLAFRQVAFVRVHDVGQMRDVISVVEGFSRS